MNLSDVLCLALLVLVLPGADLAFYIDSGAFVKILLNGLSNFSPEYQSMPLCLLCIAAVLLLPALRSTQGY
jgi:hypothetical protein